VAFGGDYKLRYGLVLSRAACVLAYAPLHVDLLRALGYPCVREVPLYSLPVSAQLRVAPPARPHTYEYEYDFVFFGGCSARRRVWLDGIQSEFPLCHQQEDRQSGAGRRAGAHERSCWRYALNCVGWENGVFDALREQQVQQSALVLNIHTDDRSVLEAHRINSLLQMGCCVVSERSDDAVLDARYATAVRFVAAGDRTAMSTMVRELLGNELELHRCREDGKRFYEHISSETQELAAAMAVAIRQATSAIPQA
jgi:hypothetical protein